MEKVDIEERDGLRWFAFICAGVWWMRLKDRQQYGWLIGNVGRAGIDVKQFNVDVAQGVENGFVVPLEFEPSPGVKAS